MIEQLTYEGETLAVSVDADFVAFDTGSPGIFATASALRKSGMDYSLFSEGNLYMDTGPGVSLAAALTAHFSESEAGMALILVPFDKAVYRATVEVSVGFTLVESEQIISFGEALELAQDPTNSVRVLSGGTLTGAFEDQSIEIYPFSFDPDNFLVTRSITTNTLAFGALAVALLLLGVFVTTSVMTRQDIEKAIPALKTTQATPLLHKDLRSLAALIETTNVLLPHGLQQLDQAATINTAAYITVAGDLKESSRFSRLEEISERIGSGEFVVSSDGWAITSIRGIKNDGPPQDLVPVATHIDSLLRILRRYSHDVRFERPVTGRDYRDYTLNFTLDYPNNLLLADLAAEVEALPIHARLGSFRLAIAEHSAWKTANLQIFIRGSNP